LHKLISAAALFVFATALFAQSPFAGTWKLNPAKSKYTTGDAPKDVTIVIEEQGDNLSVTASGTNADGSPLSVKYTVPIKGGSGQVQEGPYDAITSKVVSAHVRDNSYSKNGKEVAMRHIVVSGDGKTMRVTVKGTSTDGKTAAGTDVFDKQ
jgi:hypothetical protein